MVVVIAVIVILLALVVPAATQMWNQRAISDAENAISGLLMTTRAKAMQGDMGEMGLFFYVDQNGTQQVATIAKSPLDPDLPPPAQGDPILQWQTNDAWLDVFTIIGQPRAMPSSMRVLPRKLIEPAFVADQSYQTMLVNEDLANVPVSNNNIDRHRNFFTFIYSTRGEPQHINPGGPTTKPAMRNVLIRDRDEDKDGKGDVTGLAVGGPSQNAGPDENGATTDLYDARLNNTPSAPFSTAYSMKTGDLVPLGLIGDPGQVTTAMSFRTVDGLLVYDDALLREAGTEPDARLMVLQNTAQPFYVSRLTGAVVKGPQGENNPTP